jgi:hypothetical protein
MNKSFLIDQISKLTIAYLVLAAAWAVLSPVIA